MPLGFPLRLTPDKMNRRPNIYSALEINPGAAVYSDEQRVYAHNIEVPSGGAVGTALAIGRAYSVFGTGPDASWSYGKRRWRYWPLRRFRRRAGFTTNA